MRNRIEASVRLLCPKCDAEYEIPDDVIPAEGRDVQCSGCQETWFVPANTPPPERTTIDPKVSRILQQEVQRPPPGSASPRHQPQSRRGLRLLAQQHLRASLLGRPPPSPSQLSPAALLGQPLQLAPPSRPSASLLVRTMSRARRASSPSLGQASRPASPLASPWRLV